MSAKKKPVKFFVENGKLRHQVSGRVFRVWLFAGLIRQLVDKNGNLLPRVAEVTKRARPKWEDGRLNLCVAGAATPSVRTNAEVVDSQYIYANAGRVRLSKDDQELIADIRWRFPDAADYLIFEVISGLRQRQMRVQYGW